LSRARTVVSAACEQSSSGSSAKDAGAQARCKFHIWLKKRSSYATPLLSVRLFLLLRCGHSNYKISGKHLIVDGNAILLAASCFETKRDHE